MSGQRESLVLGLGGLTEVQVLGAESSRWKNEWGMMPQKKWARVGHSW